MQTNKGFISSLFNMKGIIKILFNPWKTNKQAMQNTDEHRTVQGWQLSIREHGEHEEGLCKSSV